VLREWGLGSGLRGYCHVIRTANIVKGNVESFNTDCTYTKRTNTESTVFCHKLIDRFIEYSRIPWICQQYILVPHKRQSVKASAFLRFGFSSQSKKARSENACITCFSHTNYLGNWSFGNVPATENSIRFRSVPCNARSLRIRSDQLLNNGTYTRWKYGMAGNIGYQCSNTKMSKAMASPSVRNT